MMTPSIAVKQSFFDRQVVIDAVGKGKAKAMAKAGSYVRTAAISLLRRRKKIANPGEPPSVHSNDPIATLRAIFFDYDFATKTEVIGPLQLNTGGAQPTSGTVPSTQEFGGKVKIVPRRRRGRMFSQTKTQAVTVRPHPFMGPALIQVQNEIPETFRDMF